MIRLILLALKDKYVGSAAAREEAQRQREAEKTGAVPAMQGKPKREEGAGPQENVGATPFEYGNAPPIPGDKRTPAQQQKDRKKTVQAAKEIARSDRRAVDTQLKKIGIGRG